MFYNLCSHKNTFPQQVLINLFKTHRINVIKREIQIPCLNENSGIALAGLVFHEVQPAMLYPQRCPFAEGQLL